MTATFDPTKPVQTRDGRKARIVAILANPTASYPIICVITEKDGSEEMESFTLNGRASMHRSETHEDLINVPETVTRYLNLGNAYCGGETAFKAAQKRSPYFKVLELVTNGDKVVSTKIHPAAEATPFTA